MKPVTLYFICLLWLFITGCDGSNYEKYIKNLKSDNVMVKYDAIDYLGREREKQAVPALVELLNDNQPFKIKLRVIKALGDIGSEDGAEALCRILKQNDLKFNLEAVEALGKIRSSKAVPLLLKMLDNKKVRLAAILSLGNIGDKNAIPALTRMLDNQDKYVTYNAAQALLKIGSGK